MRLGILFDIDGLDGGLYGYKAYKVLFHAVGLTALAGCSLLDGDTNATLCGRRNDYCIAIDAPSGAQLDSIRQALLRFSDPGLLPAADRFMEDAQVAREPLVLAARVTFGGDLIQYSGWVSEAWKMACEERQARVSAASVSASPDAADAQTAPHKRWRFWKS